MMKRLVQLVQSDSDADDDEEVNQEESEGDASDT